MSDNAIQATPDELVKAKQEPEIVNVPTRHVLAVDGVGGPGTPEFTDAISALYGIGYALRSMRKVSGMPVYKVGPLVGEWRADGANSPAHEVPDQGAWRWCLQVCVPSDTTQAQLDAVIHETTAKKKGKLEGNTVARHVKLHDVEPALFARVLHIGPYSTEPESFAKIGRLLATKGYTREFWHVEVYISDPNKTAPEKLKTALLTQISLS